MDNTSIDSFEPVARIIVIGVGGAGNNAVNRMLDQGIENVEFYVLNTDKQALALSRVEADHAIVIGEEVTKGLGAGGEPEQGRKAAESSKEKIKQIVAGANLVFIAAGMGGGTGTGASPIISKLAREAGALTIAIVTRPFSFEGEKRNKYAIEGLKELKNNVDSMIIVNNNNITANWGLSPTITAFGEADKVLATAVKTVTDLILMPAVINLDFADVRNILYQSGIALIGYGSGSGDGRAEEAALSALNNPLIVQKIDGANKGICHITCGPNVSLYDAQKCVNKIVELSGNPHMDMKFGLSCNDQLGDMMLVSVIASGFKGDINFDTNVDNMESLKEDVTKLKEEVKVDDDELSEDNLIANFISGKN